MDINEIFEALPNNDVIFKSYLTAVNKLNSPEYQNIAVSVSGGADSDIMLDLVLRAIDDCNKHKLKFIFFSTGLEYSATIKHIKQLETKYNITIDKIRPKKSITQITKEYGYPVFSKYISKKLETAQRKEFVFEDKESSQLYNKYSRAKDLIKWWNCENSRGNLPENTIGIFCVNYKKYLKDFLISHPPTFKVSSKCCDHLKKNIAKTYVKEHNIDLMLVGTRKSEGGIRSTAYKNTCFTKKDDGCDQYRPLYFWDNKEKELYKDYFSIRHSDCYEVYGLKRTGCVGCPFNLNVEKELELVKEYEPTMYKKAYNIFGKSYEYTALYKEFIKQKGKEL